MKESFQTLRRDQFYESFYNFLCVSTISFEEILITLIIKLYLHETKEKERKYCSLGKKAAKVGERKIYGAAPWKTQRDFK